MDAQGYDDEDNNYDEVQVDEADDPRNQSGYAGPQGKGKSTAKSSSKSQP